MMEHLRESRVVDNRCLEVFADMLSLMMLPSASARYTSPNAPEPSTLPDVKSQKNTVDGIFKKVYGNKDAIQDKGAFPYPEWCFPRHSFTVTNLQSMSVCIVKATNRDICPYFA